MIDMTIDSVAYMPLSFLLPWQMGVTLAFLGCVLHELSYKQCAFPILVEAIRFLKAHPNYNDHDWCVIMLSASALLAQEQWVKGRVEEAAVAFEGGLEG